MPGPFGRERCVYALPLNDNPPMLRAGKVLQDSEGSFIADPNGVLVGVAEVWIARLLEARWTEDTRRLAG